MMLTPPRLNDVCFVVTNKSTLFHEVEYQLLVPHTVARLQNENCSDIDYTVYSRSRDEFLDFLMIFV